MNPRAIVFFALMITGAITVSPWYLYAAIGAFFFSEVVIPIIDKFLDRF